MLNQALCLLLALATLNQCVVAQQYTGNQPHRHANSAVDHYASAEINRHNAEQQQMLPTSEENELRQLNHVVDTMSQLLNEEEQNEQRATKGDPMVASASDSRGQQEVELQRANNNEKAPELMSESAIRQAIEELEKIQLQERQVEEESRIRPVLAQAPEQKQVNKQQSAFESLIDELGDDLMDDQLTVGSQDAERLLQRDTNKVSDKIDQRGASEKAHRSSPYESSPAPSTTNPTLIINHHQQVHQQPQQEKQQKANQSSQNQSPFFIGQLSMASELGPSLTNDFYNFHAESNGVDRGLQMSQSEAPPIASQDRYQQSNKQDVNSVVPNYHSDLESAAQTRNSITRDQGAQGHSFSQHDPNTMRFDSFIQPHNLNAQASRPVVTHVDQNQDALVQAFRQQTGANQLNNGQFPTSTLIPLTNPDNFWRPTNNGNFQPENDGDMNQHHSRARSSQSPPLPPLPESRFQSLSPQGPFSQPAPSTRQSQHIHFTGHSFVSGQPQFPAPQQNTQFNIRDRPTLSSTLAPMISVLSGGDTSVGNSVSWNPPATINPPAQALFNQQFPTSTQSSQQLVREREQPQSFFPSPSRGSPSPLFNTAFHGIPEDAPGANNGPRQDFRQQFSTSTELSNMPETTTDNRFQSPPTTTQRSVKPFVSQLSTERDAADSEPESTIRNLPKNQRFFSPNDLLGPTSTSSPFYTEPSRPQRMNVPTTTTPTTVTTLAPDVTTPKNTTKKDDMVIYYYYYYDDNKNATVVAKNISQPSSIPLDAAIEADGGVEDTPYMDDPAPLDRTRTSSPKPPTTTSTTATTTTTTTSSSFPASINNFEPNVKPDNRLRTISGGARAQPVSTEAPTRSSQFDREFNDLPELGANQFQNDQQRTTSRSTNRLSSANPRQPIQDPSSTSPSTPNFVPLTPSSRPQSRVPPASSLDANVNTNRFVSTEPSIHRVPSSTHSHPNRAESTPNHSHNAISPAPNAKLQKDLIHSVLNGSPNTQTRQTNSFSTAPSPVTSSTTHNSRGPLSNASRYGMNNNLLLDPYGLDPSAPATIVHSSHMSTADSSGNHSKNWNPQGTATNSGTGHQFNRKPVTDVPMAVHLSSAERNQGDITRTTNQHFSSQRNQSNSPTTPSSAPHSTAAAPRVSQAVTILSSTRSSSGSSTLPSVSSSGRQFFPETGNSVLPPGIVDSIQRVSTPSSRQLNSPSAPSIPKQQPQRPQTATVPSTDFVNSNRLVSTSEDSTREPPQRLNNNGRPSTPDGNTSNGFTRSPLQLSSAPTPVPANNLAVSNERTTMVQSGQVSSTQSTTSTSSSKSFNLPSQSPPVVTSISPPTISSSTNPIITTSQTSSSSTSETTSPQTSVVSTPTPGTTSSTSAPQETNLSPENSDSAGSIARRKFGNRNNRFQTRLNSLNSGASRSTSSTTTTQAPSITSTTRRPTTSTTRRSNKQLFAGRRRLSSFSNTEGLSQPSTLTLNAGVSNSSSAVEPPTGAISSSPTFSTSSSVSSSTTSTSSSSSPQGRARFGNSFTARSRSTTQTPAPSANQPEQTVPSQKPSLFGAQRGTTKPRLPFLKPNKPSSTSAVTETTPNLAEGTVSMGGSALDGTLPTIEKSTNSEMSESPSSDTSSTGSTEVESGEKREITLASSSSPTSEATTTVSPASTQAEALGRKPRVRPLFASRQRNTSLFGNRRSTSNNATTS